VIEGIKFAVLSTDDTEQLLFFFGSIHWMNELKLDKQIIDLIGLGTEIDAIKKLLPDIFYSK
jgi:hypothetical protein